MRTETVQHGSDAQFDAATVELDEVPQDELLACIAEPLDIPRIELLLEGAQQSAEVRLLPHMP
jgi:hypothetical protein